SQPGIESASLGPLPLQWPMTTSVQMEGHDATREGVEVMRASPGYFTTLGIPFLSGRDFSRSDSAGTSGVAIISDTLARKYWPDQSALGKHISHDGPQSSMFEVLGVVGDMGSGDLRKPPGPLVYFPLAQSYLMFPWQPDITIVARTKGEPAAILPSIKAAVTSVNPDL